MSDTRKVIERAKSLMECVLNGFGEQPGDFAASRDELRFLLDGGFDPKTTQEVIDVGLSPYAFGFTDGTTRMRNLIKKLVEENGILRATNGVGPLLNQIDELLLDVNEPTETKED